MGRWVYAGGPVDYTDIQSSHAWRHELAEAALEAGLTVFCPICANKETKDEQKIIHRNEMALFAADLAVFLLDGAFTVGTPIEIHTRLERRGPGTMAIIHPGPQGVFVRQWKAQGVLVVPSLEPIPGWLRQPISSPASTSI